MKRYRHKHKIHGRFKYRKKIVAAEMKILQKFGRISLKNYNSNCWFIAKIHLFLAGKYQSFRLRGRGARNGEKVIKF